MGLWHVGASSVTQNTTGKRLDPISRGGLEYKEERRKKMEVDRLVEMEVRGYSIPTAIGTGEVKKSKL